MPPKPKFDREEIIAAAIAIAEEKGIRAITAREVGDRLGCSSRPIFTFFSGMDELLDAVKQTAFTMFTKALQIADDYAPSFKMRGYEMITFAKAHPRLYELLFMTPVAPETFEFWFKRTQALFDGDLTDLERLYGFSRDEAQRILLKIWHSTHGICSLFVAGVCTLTDEELMALLGENFAGMLLYQKVGSTSLAAQMPVPKGTPLSEALQHELPTINKIKTTREENHA